MREQACEPCAKRKVRCDRAEPCSNCVRRKHDYCKYPKLSPSDKIKRLEAHIRALGGDPENDTTFNSLPKPAWRTIAPASSPAAQSPQERQDPSPAVSGSDSRSKDPVILEEDGQQQYLESRAWLLHGHRESGPRSANAKNPLLLKEAPHAFQSVISGRQSSNSTAPDLPPHTIRILWTIFRQRVNPLTRIMFRWDIERLEAATVLNANTARLDDAESALASSIYLASIVSLTDGECMDKLHAPKVTLLSEYQASCEEAITRTNILCMKNTVALKALVFYLVVSIDRLSTQSLWTLMGIAIRNGEKLGIHRDGTYLNLSPAATEDRRRLWWQMQFVDLIFAIRLGATPLTLMADWDVKLPLNIEDDDLLSDPKSFPEERKGLTSMSYNLFTSYILDQQRKYHADKGQFELSWSTNQSVPAQTKKTFIEQLEEGLNDKFLRYCDPIKPIEVLLQMMARALVCVFRQRILLTVGEKSGYMDHEQREALLMASMQCLEYAIIMHSHPSLVDFAWLTTNGLPWPAFMVVLVEASNETDADKCQRIWILLSNLYAANTSLQDLTDDRRKLHAAELIVVAWNACLSKGTVGRSSPKPDFLITLESRLAEYAAATQVPDAKDGVVNDAENGMPFLPEDHDAAALFDLNFQDIDWSFWNSID